MDVNVRNPATKLFTPTRLPSRQVFRETEALEAVEESASYVQSTSWR